MQIIDKVLQFIWSLRGQGRKDVRTIGGLFTKIIVAEILTGAQIIAGIGITKIQKGEIDPVEYITAVINLDWKAAGLDKPVTLNEVFQAIGGEELPGGEKTDSGPGEDFDVVKYKGRDYTILYKEHKVVDDQGRKYNKSAPRVRDAWAKWEQEYGDKPAGEQVVEQNPLIGAS